MYGYIYMLVLIKDLPSFQKGEVYIGKHVGDLDNYFTGGKLPRKIVKKYGKDVFCRYVLLKTKNHSILDYYEKRFIKEFKSNRLIWNKNLNLTDGGEGQLSANIKPIIILNLNGDFVGEYLNTNQAATALKVRPHILGRCALGQRQKAGKYIAVYKENYDLSKSYKYITPGKYRPSRHRKAIVLFKGNEPHQVFSSIKEASQKLEIGRVTIADICNGLRWKYKKHERLNTDLRWVNV